MATAMWRLEPSRFGPPPAAGMARGVRLPGHARIRALIALPSPFAPLSRLLQPFAFAWVRDAWPRAAQSRLTSCLLLALLLHVWLVLMLGNAAPGTALPGLGVMGALNVTLRGPAQGAPFGATPPSAPAASPAQPAGLPGTSVSPRAGGIVRSLAAQPLPEPGAVLRGDWSTTPPPAPLERVSPLPPLAARLPLPVALPGAAAPTPLPALPASGPIPVAAVAAVAPVAPVAPVAAVAPVAPAAPRPVVAVPTPPGAALPAEPAEPAPVAPVLRQLAPIPVAAAAAAVAAPALAPVQGAPAPAAVGLPSLPAAPSGAPFAALPAGRPDAGPQVGHDVATAPSAPASAPRLNLELARPRGGELSRQGGAGVLPLLPRPPELPDKLARDISNAAKADCRKAYQGLGLLAVVPLAADALRGGKDSGCKW